MIAPRIEAMANEFKNVTFLKLDVDSVAVVASKVGISAMPTFILFKDGKKVGEVVGADERGIRALIEKNI